MPGETRVKLCKNDFKENPMYKRILVSVDGSTTSNLALDEAIGLAKGRQSKLRVVHVNDTINLNLDSMA